MSAFRMQLADATNLLDNLASIGHLPKEVAARLVRRMSTSNINLEQVASSLSQDQARLVLKAQAEFFGYGFLEDCESELICVNALDLLTTDFCRQNELVPLLSPEGAVATARPSETAILNEVGFRLRLSVQPIVVPPALIRRLLADTEEPELLITESANNDNFEVEGSETARALDQLILEATELRASDIHLEATEESLKVRLRVDGLLQHHPFAVSRPAEIIARLKLLGGMSVTERRLPQDGGCRRFLGGRRIEMRLSTLPTVHGESMVCRLLDPKGYRRGWENLGFSEVDLTRIKSLVSRTSGLLLVSGATGSGKTTTLYTALNHLNDGVRKIITVEDPVEQQIDGIEQVQINTGLGLSFDKVLRSILRQDPDVIMIGEVRDTETAEMACRAALVGRLVFATVHASSPRLARERFVNLGVPAYLVDEVLIGIIQQALVRLMTEEGRRLSSEIWIAPTKG